MSQPLLFGIMLILLAGLMAGDCMLPIKFNRYWQWENTWLIFSVVSLFVLPWLLALGLVNHLITAYHMLSAGELAVPVLFGAGWGIAQVLFGLSIQRLGLGLAYAIVVGLGTLLGTLVPLFAQHRAQLSRAILVNILLGIAVMLLGIVLSAWAGNKRERACPAVTSSQATGRYSSAILLAVLCGLLAPMLNYSFAFGQPIALAAEHVGNSAVRAAYAIWPIGLAGGLLPNVAYSLYLLRKNRTATLYRALCPDLYWALLMAGLWMGAFALYGMSASYLGIFGTSIGWGLFQILMIMTATMSGVLAGEWKGAQRPEVRLLAGSLVCLTTATVLLAMANHTS